MNNEILEILHTADVNSLMDLLERERKFKANPNVANELAKDAALKAHHLASQAYSSARAAYLAIQESDLLSGLADRC